MRKLGFILFFLPLFAHAKNSCELWDAATGSLLAESDLKEEAIALDFVDLHGKAEILSDGLHLRLYQDDLASAEERFPPPFTREKDYKLMIEHQPSGDLIILRCRFGRE